MHPRVILAIARKDAIDILQNRSTLGTLLVPIFLSLLWLLISRMVGAHTTTILVDNSGHSGVVQVITGAFPDAKVTEAGSASAVTAAFGPDGTHKKSSYAVGMIVPANFDNELRAGNHAQLNLYLNGDQVSKETDALVQAAINNYARTVANPQPPVDLVTAMINPPSETNAGATLSQVYGSIALLVSLIVGTTFVPQLLVEEKEKKTIRTLMVSPASFEDIILGKLLVVLVYQFILTVVVLVILGGLAGQIWLVLVFAVLGGCLSLALGLLLGAVLQTASAAAAVAGFTSMFYIVAGIFVGPLGKMLANSPVIRVVRFLPTYYVADGAYNASQNQGSFGGSVLDIAVILGSTILLLVISTWVLRRQAAVVGTI